MVGIVLNSQIAFSYHLYAAIDTGLLLKRELNNISFN